MNAKGRTHVTIARKGTAEHWEMAIGVFESVVANIDEKAFPSDVGNAHASLCGALIESAWLRSEPRRDDALDSGEKAIALVVQKAAPLAWLRARANWAAAVLRRGDDQQLDLVISRLQESLPALAEMAPSDESDAVRTNLGVAYLRRMARQVDSDLGAADALRAMEFLDPESNAESFDNARVNYLRYLVAQAGKDFTKLQQVIFQLEEFLRRGVDSAQEDDLIFAALVLSGAWSNLPSQSACENYIRAIGIALSAVDYLDKHEVEFPRDSATRFLEDLRLEYEQLGCPGMAFDEITPLPMFD